MRSSSTVIMVALLVCASSLPVEAVDQSASVHASFFTRLGWAFTGVPDATIVTQLGGTPTQSLADCQAALQIAQQNVTDDEARILTLTQQDGEQYQQLAGMNELQSQLATAQSQLAAKTLQDGNDQQAFENCTIALTQSNATLNYDAANEPTCQNSTIAQYPTTGDVGTVADCQTALAAAQQDLAACQTQTNNSLGDIEKYDQLYEEKTNELADTQAQLSSTHNQLAIYTAQSEAFQNSYMACEACAAKAGATC